MLALFAFFQVASGLAATAQQSTSQPTDDERFLVTPPTVEAPDRHGPTAEFFVWPQPASLEGPLVTDRPGFSDSAILVPRGHAHLELGYVYAYDKEEGAHTNTQLAPGTSLRIGLLDDFELRVKWNGMSYVERTFQDISPAGRRYTHKQRDDGGGDINIGFKVPILKRGDTELPNISILPALWIPMGSETKTTGDVDPEFRFAWNLPVNEKLTIYGVGSIASISDIEERFAQATGSLAASYAVTSKFSLFVEYFGIYPNSRTGDCSHNLNGGPVYLINDNIQLDLAVGMGLNEEAPDFFISTGISFRF